MKTRLIQVVPTKACVAAENVLYRRDMYEFGKALHDLGAGLVNHRMLKAFKKAVALMQSAAFAGNGPPTCAFELRGDPAQYAINARRLYTPKFLAALLFVLAYRSRVTGELYIDEAERTGPERVSEEEYFSKSK